ncbi:hypothetical protein [Peterkaempfera bronchialis]|uniref:hypothetical protein n=1 Tax=Peterkaempfera bronchialis TaxID=2126346 RepID=UPI0013B3AB51|nr:hypothetical protein [Peterkaempfera bronchialis]
MSPETLMMLARPISEEGGPGIFLRVVVIAAVVGVLLLVWAIARAGRDNSR